jgi:hypothetical protein
MVYQYKGVQMYLWIVVVTFLSALAGYVLPLRNDMVKVVDTPAAEALLMQMVIKHQAGLSYMKRQEWPYECSETGCANYVAGSLDDIDLQTYAASFLADGLANSSFKSFIKCYKVEGTTYESRDNCNKNEDTDKNGLITYGKLSEKWLEKQGMPSADLLNAFAKKFKYSKNVGYLVKRDSSYYIKNYRGNEFLIPPVYYDDGVDLADECDAATCLVYLTLR